MNIVYLYSEIMGYTLTTCKVLASKGNQVHVVHWDHKKLSEYNPVTDENIFLYKRSRYNYEKIKQLINKVKPKIIVISGWMDKSYLKAARYFKSQDMIIVCALDNIWKNTYKQLFLSFFSKFKILHIFFNYFWIPGTQQYNFLKNIGIGDENIIFDFYSADVKSFQKSHIKYHNDKKKKYPYKFLYVGRFEKVKGIENLKKAWDELSKLNHNWSLTLVGNGSYQSKFDNYNNVDVINFLQPEKLIEVVADCGCFVLPSNYEAWGVVVHEFSAAGMPLILSNKIGSKSMFLIEGYNGYSFDINNTQSLVNAFMNIINKSDSDLIKMSERSVEMSNRITPYTSAASLLSVCEKNQKSH